MAQNHNIDRYFLDQASNETNEIARHEAYTEINNTYGYQTQGPESTPVALTVPTSRSDIASYGNGDAWRQAAACVNTDTDLFFPQYRGDSMRAGRAICAVCDVAGPCLEDAMQMGDELQGIRGGIDHSQRRKLRKQRGRQNRSE